MNDSIKRLMRDFNKMQNDAPSGINASPIDDDLLRWEAVIFGYIYNIVLKILHGKELFCV
jgi:ubiquitin-protein ligase